MAYDLQTYIPIITLVAVFILIAARRFGSILLPMWSVMLFGAITVLLTGAIGPARAVESINANVMIFLFAMFVVGVALAKSGYLFHLSHSLFKSAGSVNALVLRIVFVAGLFSALLMNDTVAVIGAPLMIYFAHKHKIAPKVLLLALCFSITIGSVFSPIGNPQNILIATGGGVSAPFAYFAWYLFIPTIINLVITYLVLRIFYKREFHAMPLLEERAELTDRFLAGLTRVSLILIFVLSVISGVGSIFHAAFDFNMAYIALAGCLPILIFSRRRLELIEGIDWRTLVFFAAMFVLTDAVWSSGVIQSLFIKPGAASVDTILVSSVLLSQALSNVPFVALYLPILSQIGTTSAQLAALAAGSTIAGNFFILGAASNVIVIQGAERSGETITFFEFARIGVLLTGANLLVYWAYFRIIG